MQNCWIFSFLLGACIVAVESTLDGIMIINDDNNEAASIFESAKNDSTMSTTMNTTTAKSTLMTSQTQQTTSTTTQTTKTKHKTTANSSSPPISSSTSPKTLTSAISSTSEAPPTPLSALTTTTTTIPQQPTTTTFFSTARLQSTTPQSTTTQSTSRIMTSKRSEPATVTLTGVPTIPATGTHLVEPTTRSVKITTKSTVVTIVTEPTESSPTGTAPIHTRTAPIESTTSTMLQSTVAPSKNPSGGGFKPWMIAIIVICLLIPAAGILGFIYWRRWKQRQDIISPSHSNPLNAIMKDQELGRIQVTDGRRKNINLIRKASSSRSKQIKLTQFEEKVQMMHRDHDFMFQAEFEKLDEISPSLPHDRTSLVAMNDENAGKNRFIDILPFENRNRVSLQDGDEYINASYLDGYTRPREYIATQGPLGPEEEQQGRRKATVIDFWRMVWQEESQCIIMLTKCMEQFRIKCAQYWPRDVKGIETYGQISVTLTAEIDRTSYVQRTFTVEKLDANEAPRSVTHWYYPHWPDMRQTEEEDLLNFIETIRYSGCMGISKPTIVHCSAGVGRSGSYIALDLLLQQIRDNDFADIFGCVYTLRTQRLRMVQTLDQYILLYNCLDLRIRKKLEDAQRESREDGFPHDYENLNFKKQNSGINSNDGDATYEEIKLEDLEPDTPADVRGEDLQSTFMDDNISTNNSAWNTPGSRLTFGIPKTVPLESHLAKSKADAVKHGPEMGKRRGPSFLPTDNQKDKEL